MGQSLTEAHHWYTEVQEASISPWGRFFSSITTWITFHSTQGSPRQHFIARLPENEWPFQRLYIKEPTGNTTRCNNQINRESPKPPTSHTYTKRKRHSGLIWYSLGTSLWAPGNCAVPSTQPLHSGRTEHTNKLQESCDRPTALP